MRMAATGGDAWIGVGDDLAQVFRGNRTTLMGGIGIVVERHEAVLLDDGFGPCQSFFASEFCLLRHLDISLTAFETGILVQRLQQFPVKRILPYSLLFLLLLRYIFFLYPSYYFMFPHRKLMFLRRKHMFLHLKLMYSDWKHKLSHYKNTFFSPFHKIYFMDFMLLVTESCKISQKFGDNRNY